MRVPRFRLTVLMLAVATFAGWLTLFRAYPVQSLIGFVCGVPLFALVLLEMKSDDGRDRERRAIYRAYLWIGLSGITAFAVHLAVGGGRILP